jgi:hypothetical protein
VQNVQRQWHTLGQPALGTCVGLASFPDCLVIRQIALSCAYSISPPTMATNSIIAALYANGAAIARYMIRIIAT